MDSMMVQMAQFFSRRAGRRQPITLDLLPIESEELTASQFLDLTESNPAIIKNSHVVAPQPGKPGFGKIFVSYKHPIYKTKAA